MLHRTCLLVALAGCSGAPPPASRPVESNVASAYRACAAAYNARRWDQLRTCYAAEVVQDEPGTGKPWVGIDDVIDHLRLFVASFPDNTSEPVLTLVNGRRIASVVVLRGINDGPFPNAPGPTHKPIGLELAHVVDLDSHDKVKTEWILYDTLTMLGQLGMLPVPTRDRLTAAASPVVVEASGDAREAGNIAAYRTAVDAFNAHDLARVGDGFADPLVWRDERLPSDLGRADALADIAGTWKLFADLRRTPVTVWPAGDYVVAAGQMTGTSESGKKIDATYVEIAHFTSSKRDRSWLFYNGIVIASQLGLL
jgi:ketosteroid isomerase-like protein